jgi:addiction module HigA family antidote
LAQRLDVDVFELTNVVDGCCAISPEMAARLEVELGLSADLWLRMQAEYDAAHC